MNDNSDLKQEVFGGGGIARRILPPLYAVRGCARRLMGKPLRILIGIRWRLGDEIMALPIYEALAKQYPGSQISIWCNYPDLLIDNPCIHEINPPKPVFDWFIDLRSAPRQAYRLQHYAELAHIDLPLEQPRLCYNDWNSQGRKYGTDPARNERPGLSPVFSLRSRTVVLAPGASWSTKRWPLENWKTVASALVERGYDVVELGVEGDPDIGVGQSLLGKTTIRQAACILHSADLLIACDSGLMHLALAAGTPVLALFGPTDPSILVRDNPKLIPIRRESECAGCWNSL